MLIKTGEKKKSVSVLKARHENSFLVWIFTIFDAKFNWDLLTLDQLKFPLPLARLRLSSVCAKLSGKYGAPKTLAKEWKLWRTTTELPILGKISRPGLQAAVISSGMKINLELVGELTELRTSSSALRFLVARYRIVGKSNRARWWWKFGHWPTRSPIC